MAGNYAGFNSVQLKKPSRSHFDLSHEKRLTTVMGRLTPVLIEECIPSDSFRGSSEMLLRLAPLLAPIYDRIRVYVHFFFVPNRLLWDEWETFITGGRLGVGVDPVSAPVPPFIDIGNFMTAGFGSMFGKSNLADYLGVPDLVALDPTAANWDGRTLDMMPFAAYQLVFQEYYRDRNFVADEGPGIPEMPLASGELSPAGATNFMSLRVRAYEHDYFTSALPFTQRGEEVLMPVALGGNAPLYFEPFVGDGPTEALVSADANGYTMLNNNGPSDPPAGAQLFVKGEDFDGTSTSINDFRSAYALQVWLERNAVGGSRYTESTQAHFGVKPQDSRLQRPEYIGGGLINVGIQEVVSTAWAVDNTDASVPQANLAGRGISYGTTNKFNYFCTEHGFIIGIMSIMNPPSYQQGLPRLFQRKSFLDYPWPTFAKLGEQPVWDFEIYATPTALEADANGEYPVFGYQSRYADWKYRCSTNHGDFKDTLLYWTLTRVFDDAPVLNEGFVTFDDNTQARIFAQNLTENWWAYIHNEVHVKRALPYFGTPNTLNFG